MVRVLGSDLGKAFVFLLIYLGTARILQGDYVFSQAFLWLPTGVAVAGVWLLGARFWVVVFAGTCLHRILSGYSFPSYLPAAIGNSLEALLAMAVLRAFGFRNDIRRLRDVAALVAASIAAPALGATFGRAIWFFRPDYHSYFWGWWGWWRMNALGMLVVLPPALAWTADPPRRPRAGVLVESAAITLAVLALVGFLIKIDVANDQSGMVLSYLALPVAIYGALRFGVRGAATASAGAVVLLTLGTVHGIGPFVAPTSMGEPSYVRVLAFQAVVAIVMVAPVLLAAVLSEREAALADVASERNQRQELLASMDRNVNEGLFRSDPRQGLVYVNAGLARMLGYDDRAGLIGTIPSALFADPARYEAIRLRLRANRFVHNEEAALLRRDGSRLPVLLSCTLVHGSDGATQFVDGAVSDITTRQRLEEQLRQSQKMEALGQLAGGVAHDFNNLLTVIGGFAECLRDELSEGSRPRHDADEILHASNRASSLTRQLLAYSRRQRLDPSVHDLREIVEHMSGMLRRLIGEHITFEIRSAPHPLRVRVDRGQIEQVLLNLVVNARDAMPKGGTLTISTSWVEIDASHPNAEPDTTPGPHACLRVDDTGVGMRDDVCRRAFDPFFTTKGPGKGTGLGLSTVFGIVRQSGGLVWIESELERGTRLIVCLPVVDEVPTPDADSSARVASWGSDRTVLVVEDEPGVRDLVSRTLKLAGFHVVVAKDGEEGLAVARSYPGPIDLLVTDVVMPRLGGYELVARLGADRPELKVLFVSGYMNEGDERMGLQAPDRDFLQKPFTPSALLQRVQMRLAGAPMQTE